MIKSKRHKFQTTLAPELLLSYIIYDLHCLIYRPFYVETATPKPKDVVLVIDQSGSMAEIIPGSSLQKMAVARAAIKSVIDTLNPNDRVRTIVGAYK